MTGKTPKRYGIARPFYREPSPIFAINCEGKNDLLR
jgi:hypothetical protein